MSDRGQGRKPLSPTGETMKPRQIRMTDGEWAKCIALGGAGWVRNQIKKAKPSTPPLPPSNQRSED